MQCAESDDEYRHAGLRSNPLIPNPADRCCDQAVRAPKRAGGASTRLMLSLTVPQFGRAKAILWHSA